MGSTGMGPTRCTRHVREECQVKRFFMQWSWKEDEIMKNKRWQNVLVVAIFAALCLAIPITAMGNRPV